MRVVYHPDAGTGDADKLALLASAGLPTSRPNRDFRRTDTLTGSGASG
ncbi:hypothetical protein [Actinoplanes sandaracinus]|nr:hypothetical protein [Actinoplanes sandaracinus]